MTLFPRPTNGEMTERMRPHIPMPVSVSPSSATSVARTCGSSQAPVTQYTTGMVSASVAR